MQHDKIVFLLLVFFLSVILADDEQCATIQLLDKTHFTLKATPQCSTIINPGLLQIAPDSAIPINFLGDGLLPYVSMYEPSAHQLSLFRTKRIVGISCAVLVLPLALIGITAGIENTPAGESYGPLGPNSSSGWGYQKVYTQKITPLFWTMISISGASILSSVYCWVTARHTLKKSVTAFNTKFSTCQ